MDIDDSKLFDFMQNVQGSLGRIESRMSAADSHLRAVSDKATRIEGKIDNHALDVEAHGLGAVGKSHSGTIAVISLIVAVTGGLVTLVQAFK